MADKKYSVFISSTFDDLEDERNGVLRAVLEHGHFPLGMELWGAANDQQWQIITRQIDVADYYVVIVAQRYGSAVDGISWTEREYDYAVERGVPVLGFLLKEGADWKTNFIDKNDLAQSLDKFKNKIQGRPVSFWTTAEDLRTKVVLALGREIQATPRIGWVRANEALLPATANEFARLSDENARLRSEIAEVSRSKLPDIGLDVTRAFLRADRDRTPGAPPWKFSFQIWFDTTLRHGVPVGFASYSCTSKICFSSRELEVSKIILMTSGGGTLENIKIDGPSDFRVVGMINPVQLENGDFSDIAKVSFSIKPIGYQGVYMVEVPLHARQTNDTYVREWHWK